MSCFSSTAPGGNGPSTRRSAPQEDEVYRDIKDRTRSQRIAYFRDPARALEEKTGTSVKLPRAGRWARGVAARRSSP